MLSEYEAQVIRHDVMNESVTLSRPALRLAVVLLIVTGLGWIGGYGWVDSAAVIVAEAQR